MKIRKFKPSDSREVGNLIAKTFKRFNNNEGTKEGLEWYLGMYKDKNLDNLKKRLKSKIFYIAEEENRIIGMVRGTENRLINLFVDGQYHRKSIGKILVENFEREARRKGSHKIIIRASLYATPFYQEMGYRRTTGTRNFRGIKINPMVKSL